MCSPFLNLYLHGSEIDVRLCHLHLNSSINHPSAQFSLDTGQSRRRDSDVLLGSLPDSFLDPGLNVLCSDCHVLSESAGA
jgi:hypothetical protein